ncbi:hypothetical protein MMC08_002720 [Hypocenomyce scalaris]|nr:hypothetical protein [Hypocenomyce scalaris]
MSLRALVNLGLLLIILPAITHVLVNRYSLRAMNKDLRLSQCSGILLTVGSVAMALSEKPAGVAAGLVVFALGSAIHLTARSLVASMVEPNQVGTLFTAIAVVSGAGQLIAGPMLANAIRRGMILGGAWIGLPFVVAAGLYLLVTAALVCVRLPEGGEEIITNEEHVE